MKKLILINPANTEHQKAIKKWSKLRFMPLGLAYVAAVTPDHWEVELMDENFEEIKFKSADLVGITSLTCSANRAYKIASLFRNKGIPVIMGGIHASMLPEEALKFVDSVLVGEGETVWREVINDVEMKNLKRIYYGIPVTLEKLPKPRRDIFNGNYWWSAVQTSRGCPMNCDFCSVTAFNGRFFRQRSVSDVISEIAVIKNRVLFFTDDNLIGFSRRDEERAIELFNRMIDKGIKKYWMAQVSLNFLEKERIVKLASKSGCKAVFVGIESINEETLKSMNKVINLKTGIKNYKKLIERLHKNGIAIIGAIVLGNDSDGKEVFKRTADFIVESGIDVAQLTVLTPLPGTSLFNRLYNEKRIVYNDYPKDWDNYALSRLVFIPKKLTLQDFSEGWKLIVDRIFPTATLLRRAIRTLFATRSLIATFISFGLNRAYQMGYFISYLYNGNWSIRGKQKISSEEERGL